jgi:hypothetical protein
VRGASRAGPRPTSARAPVTAVASVTYSYTQFYFKKKAGAVCTSRNALCTRQSLTSCCHQHGGGGREIVHHHQQQQQQQQQNDDDENNMYNKLTSSDLVDNDVRQKDEIFLSNNRSNPQTVSSQPESPYINIIIIIS